MPGTEGMEPSREQIQTIRNGAKEKFEELGLDNFNERDLSRLETSDDYVARFFLHVYDLPGEQEEEAITMILQTFKWRKEFEVEDINIDNVNKAFFEKGAVFSHNRDRDGKKLLVFEVRKHIKGVEKMDEMKKFFVYYLERIDQEENGDKITIVFDCTNCGLKNMDMEFIQFIIGCFKDYYPCMLNYILVFEMPWVLNAAWKIIKAWLPASGVKLIKFLTKSNINEYIDESNALEAWGGSDPWIYDSGFSSTPPDTPTTPLAPTSLHLSEGDDSTKKKSVTFAEVNPSPSEESLSSLTSQGSPSKPTNTDSILRLVPSDEVLFSPSPAGDLISRVQVVSLSPRVTGYKIKTTSPEKYRVRPSSGILTPGGSANIELHVAAANVANAASLVRDKFLITAVYLDREDLTHQQLQEALKSARPEGQYRLRCALAADHSPPPSSQLSKNPPSSQTPNSDSQLDSMARKLNKLCDQNEQLSSQLKTSHIIQTCLLVIIACILLYLVWNVGNSCESSSDGSPVLETDETAKATELKPEL